MQYSKKNENKNSKHKSDISKMLSSKVTHNAKEWPLPV